MADFVPCDHLLQRPIRPFTIKGHGSIAHSASPLGLVTFRANCARYEKDFKDNKDNNRHLARKYARMFVLGHYLFLVAHSFLELRSRKTVRFSEQIMSADKYPSIFSRQMATIVYIFSLDIRIFFSGQNKKNDARLARDSRLRLACFSRYSAPIHSLVHGHMTSNNETVSRKCHGRATLQKL